MKNIFDRVEKKYVISEEQYISLMEKIECYLEKDKYFFNQINNIYYDTINNDLLIKSLQKPVYKEKVRIRSYGVPKLNDTIFLEIKKKYKGTVNKRRVSVTLEEFNNFIKHGTLPPNSEKQISKEIEYYFKTYKLQPQVFIAYDRYSYYAKEDENFRITFDINLRRRYNDLNLEKGDYGSLYSNKKMYIMELKTLGAIPLWFVKIINEMKIYPTSFSKIGKIYEKDLINIKCLDVS